MRVTAIALGAALTSSLVGQSGFTTQVTALAPIVAEWTNAPTGTIGAVVTHPAGPLPNAATVVGVTIGSSTNAMAFYCSPTTPEPGVVSSWSFSASATTPVGQFARTSADLLIRVTGPQDAVCTADFRLSASGDTPNGTAFEVDVGCDGTVEFNTWPSFQTTSLDRRAAALWDFAEGPLLVRILHAANGSYMPQGFGVLFTLRPWIPDTAGFGDDCGNEAPASGNRGYFSRYHLAALPPLAPTEIAALRAIGMGPFSAFLISDRPKTVTFHLQGSTSLPCDLLSDVIFLDSGFVSRTVWSHVEGDIPVEWIAPVPQLPPGLEIHLQHASLYWPYLGFTNRVRLRT